MFRILAIFIPENNILGLASMGKSTLFCICIPGLARADHGEL